MFGTGYRERFIAGHDPLRCTVITPKTTYLSRVFAILDCPARGKDESAGRLWIFAGDRRPLFIEHYPGHFDTVYGSKSVYVWSGHLYADLRLRIQSVEFIPDSGRAISKFVDIIDFCSVMLNIMKQSADRRFRPIIPAPDVYYELVSDPTSYSPYIGVAMAGRFADMVVYHCGWYARGSRKRHAETGTVGNGSTLLEDIRQWQIKDSAAVAEFDLFPGHEYWNITGRRKMQMIMCPPSGMFKKSDNIYYILDPREVVWRREVIVGPEHEPNYMIIN